MCSEFIHKIVLRLILYVNTNNITSNKTLHSLSYEFVFILHSTKITTYYLKN